MIVREIMTHNLECIHPQASIHEAAKIMKNKNIGSLPVVENNKSLGLITDRDITVRCTAEGRNPQSSTVRDCMTKSPISIYEDETVEEASKRMVDHQVRRILVTDREQHPVGMLNLKHIGTLTHDDKLVNKTMQDFYTKSHS